MKMVYNSIHNLSHCFFMAFLSNAYSDLLKNSQKIGFSAHHYRTPTLLEVTFS